jgi:NitT/TauT family transport system permease protein
LQRKALQPVGETLILKFADRHAAASPATAPSQWRVWIMRILGMVALGAITYALIRVLMMLVGVGRSGALDLTAALATTFLRVNVALLIGAAWTIPAGVLIGFNPRLARIAQPLAQIAASVPATAFFPIILLLLVRMGSGLGIGSILLLLLGTQWYILFNVIAGAMAIPTDLKEACSVFGIEGWERWRKLILPGIFPYLVTGLVTASGGAWNASIVAEYFHFKGQIFSTMGLGAIISQATDQGNFELLIAATLLMAAMVVTINRLVWRRLYKLAETRFRLEG